MGGKVMRAEMKAAPAGNRGLTHTFRLRSDVQAEPHATERPTPTQQLALIRSLAGHCEGHEDRALTEIAAVLGGATLTELVAARGGA